MHFDLRGCAQDLINIVAFAAKSPLSAPITAIIFDQFAQTNADLCRFYAQFGPLTNTRANHVDLIMKGPIPRGAEQIICASARA